MRAGSSGSSSFGIDGSMAPVSLSISRLRPLAPGRTAAPLMTPGYGAPEQRDGGPVTLATDVHALGVMLREVLTGRAPNKSGACVDNASAAHAGAMPAELAWIIARATDAERPTSVGEHR